jgi:cell division protein FtsA
MSEILDFVTYHLKQVGLENKMLNGGIILTGGGSQLKHLIQLAEYVTGLDARIGFPNEHLASGHIEELTRPMYATCIGLILKGYNVYENSLDKERYKTLVPKEEKAEEANARKAKAKEKGIGSEKTKKRTKSLKEFMDSIKGGLIELFKEEGDEQLK